MGAEAFSLADGVSSMDSKPFYASKTFWGNIIGPVAAWAAAKYGLSFSPDQQVAAVAATMAVLNIILRAVTNSAITLT